MPIRRVVILCILGFTLPVGLALGLSRFLFSAPDDFDEYARARLLESRPARLTSPIDEAPPAELERSSFREVASSSGIDPSPNSVFLVSTKIRFLKLPEVGQRERLFYKYSVSQQPYPGWAVALRRWPGSVRPEVYWKDSQGKGGWYAFGDVVIREGDWYTFTFVVEEASALSLYVTPEGGNPLDSGFVGGVSIQQVALPSSADPLFLAPLIAPQDRGLHPVEASELVIAEVDPQGLKQLRRKLRNSKVPLAKVLEKSQVRLLLSSTRVEHPVAS